MKKRTVALLCAAVMLLGIVFGGTMALLSKGSDPLTNTFAAGEINLTLEETTGEKYVMAPGAALSKDPTVTVTAGSEDCYVFVKVEENNFGTGEKPVDWEIADGWKEVKGAEELVYYRVYDKEDADGEPGVYPVLKDNQVSIPDTLTKQQMKDNFTNKNPQLIFTAYAIQKDWLTQGEKTLTEADILDIWGMAKAEAAPVTPEQA